MKVKYLGKEFLEKNHIEYKAFSCISGKKIEYNIGVLDIAFINKRAIHELMISLADFLETDIEKINIESVSRNKFINSIPETYMLGYGTANIVIFYNELYYFLTANHVAENIYDPFACNIFLKNCLEIDRENAIYKDLENDIALVPLILNTNLIKNLKPAKLATLNCMEEIHVYGGQCHGGNSIIHLTDVELMVSGRYFNNFKAINSKINCELGVKNINHGDSGSAVFNNEFSFEGMLIAINDSTNLAFLNSVIYSSLKISNHKFYYI